MSSLETQDWEDTTPGMNMAPLQPLTSWAELDKERQAVFDGPTTELNGQSWRMAAGILLKQLDFKSRGLVLSRLRGISDPAPEVQEVIAAINRNIKRN